MLSSFVVELWTKYAIATATMIFRFITRWKMVGWRNFDGTDFWCAVSIVSHHFSFFVAYHGRRLKSAGFIQVLYTVVSVCDYILSTRKYLFRTS